MKKICFFILFLFTGSLLPAQNSDSLVVAKVVDSLIQVARGLTDKREFAKALEVNAAAEKIAFEKFSLESAAYGRCCMNRGRVLFNSGDYTNAEKWHLKSKIILEKTLGKEHPNYTSSLNYLANLYKEIGSYEKAEPLYIESIDIKEKTVGKENPSYAGSLNNLALLYQQMGRYEKAEPLFVESKNIREKVLGKEHPDYATSMNNLAVLYYNMGYYEKAEPLYIKSKDIREKTLGKEHLDYAASLNNLANLHKEMGRYEKIESLYIESKNIREKALGKEHPNYALSVFNLANLYKEMGHYEKAETLYLEALAIREKKLGKEHYLYAKNLNALGSLYSAMSRYEKAETLYLEAKDLTEKALGTEHPHYAHCLNNLAIMYDKMGYYEKAEPLFFESKYIREKALGKDHLDYAQTLNNLAIMFYVVGQYVKAETFQQEVSTINMHLMGKSMLYLSEQELKSYLNVFSQKQNRPFSFIQSTGSTMLSGTAYDNTLFHKGFLQNAAIRVNHPTLPDSVTTEQYYLFKSLQRRLAAEYAKPIAERKNVEALENQANDLEKELARKIAGYGEAIRQVKWQEVQAALKPGEAAIEFVHYRYWHKKETDSTLYAALVLRPGMVQPQFVPLFEEKQLETLLASNGQTPDLFYKNLYGWEGKGQQLHTLVWNPLLQALSGAKTVYFAPSGLLHRLNLGAIPSAPQTLSSDQYRLTGLSSTRQLVVKPSESKPNAEAMLFGGIQYDMDSTAVLREQANFSNGLRGQLDFAQSDSTLRGGSWRYLPGTEKEVAELENIIRTGGLKAQVFKGFAGSEARFKAMPSPSPRILHLATHGFFFPDPKVAAAQTNFDEQVVFKSSDYPLMRSGLVLAGGNYAWQTGKPLKPGVEDGILTAYEISHLNLSQTELVVLSACETALGDIKGSEGIYGLQRAFKIAGAQRVLMSLWQVPDQQTARLMSLFYKNWLTDKMPVTDALRAAQNTLRTRGYDPFYWAGFMLVE